MSRLSIALPLWRARYMCRAARGDYIVHTFAAVSRAALPTARAASATWGATGHVTCRRNASRRQVRTPGPTPRPADACTCVSASAQCIGIGTHTRPTPLNTSRMIAHLIMLPSNMLGAIFKMSMNLAPRHHAYVISIRAGLNLATYLYNSNVTFARETCAQKVG